MMSSAGPPANAEVTSQGGLFVARLAKARGQERVPDPIARWRLEVGDLAAGGNDFGRFGRVAAFRGFEWQGTELLTGRQAHHQERPHLLDGDGRVGSRFRRRGRPRISPR